MFKEITIHQFRSCSGLYITDIEDILILVGKNGVGKTNLLKAINWAAGTARSITPISERNFVVGHVSFTIAMMDVVFEYSVRTSSRVNRERGRTENFLSETLFVTRLGEETRQLFAKDRESLVVGEGDERIVVNAGPLTPSAFSILSLMPTHPVASHLSPFVSFLSGVRYYPLVEVEAVDEFRTPQIFTREKLESWQATGTELTPNELVIAKLLSFYLFLPERFKEAKDLLGDDGLGVLKDIAIHEFDLPSSLEAEKKQDGGVQADASTSKFYWVTFAPSMHNGDAAYRFDNLSFGTRRVTRLIVNMLHDEALVSLIEQPEDGIHPGLLKKLLPILKAYAVGSSQFFVASHASEVLNAADPRELRLVEMIEGVTKVRALDARELNAADEYVVSEGQFSDFVRSLQE